MYADLTEDIIILNAKIEQLEKFNNLIVTSTFTMIIGIGTIFSIFLGVNLFVSKRDYKEGMALQTKILHDEIEKFGDKVNNDLIKTKTDYEDLMEKSLISIKECNNEINLNLEQIMKIPSIRREIEKENKQKK